MTFSLVLSIIILMEEPAPNKNLEFLPLQKAGDNPFSLRNIERSTYLQLVVLLGIAVLIAATLYAYLQFSQNRRVREQTGSEKTQTSDQTDKLSQIEVQSKQDQQRKNDIATINSALKSFFLKEKKAPDSLKELVPDYLGQMPSDPTTQKEYSYRPAGDKKSWTVAATLSSGTNFVAKGP